MEFSSSTSDKQDRSYERIGPTAWFVAYQRTLSDIPFAQEIFLELQQNIKLTQSTEIEDLKKLMEFSEANPGLGSALQECKPYFENPFHQPNYRDCGWYLTQRIGDDQGSFREIRRG